MPFRSSDWGFKSWCGGALVIAPLLFLCERYLDIPLALWVEGALYQDSLWARHTSHLPDLLLPLVLVTTVVSLAVYLVRRKNGKDDPLNLFLKVNAWTAPVAFLLKGVLKHLFGRVNTRVWLQDPRLYGFHWLDGGEGFEGFPSGHMLVLVALLAVVWRFFPRLRLPCGGVALFLGGALVATNYHFLSDVVAGGYLALGVELFLFRALAAPSREGAGCRG